jgi:hypothetical protein
MAFRFDCKVAVKCEWCDAICTEEDMKICRDGNYPEVFCLNCRESWDSGGGEVLRGHFFDEDIEVKWIEIMGAINGK